MHVQLFFSRWISYCWMHIVQIFNLIFKFALQFVQLISQFLFLIKLITFVKKVYFFLFIFYLLQKLHLINALEVLYVTGRVVWGSIILHSQQYQFKYNSWYQWKFLRDLAHTNFFSRCSWTWRITTLPQFRLFKVVRPFCFTTIL